MSEVPTRSDLVSPELEGFLELRGSLISQRLGSGGRDVCKALTTALDGALQQLAAKPETPSDVAVIALGGYGRQELSLFSDVDLMLLHDSADPSDAAASLFRPLWDAGLRVGHSVRTVKEAATAARERFDTFTTLLTSRFVAGESSLADQLITEISAVTRARPLREYLIAEERQRRVDSAYLLMGADVKTGRGGLRTLHAFEWERRREALIGRFSPAAGPEEETTREILLAIRNALHAAAGRAYDTFSYDLREPVSRWLGSELPDIAEGLVEAMVTVDHLAAKRWPELARDKPGFPKLSARRLRADTAPSSPDQSVEDFVALLSSGERGRLALERLRESGRLRELLPQWETARVVPQLAPFHEHPLEAHLWRTVDEMRALIQGDDHYSAVARELASPDALILAAFLHDIGKGQGGDHAVVGAVIARETCDRLGCPSHVSSLVEKAVEQHLLLSETAMRRDLDDPAVIGSVAEAVGDLRSLMAVYLVTVADSKATGRTMWTRWKATLLRTLFVRCAALFVTEPQTNTGTTREQVVVHAPASLRPRAETHIDAMPPEYLRSASADDVLWHIDLIAKLTGKSQLGVRAGDLTDTAVLVGRGHRELRRCVAESLASNGIDVLQARMATRADGMVIDTFEVCDDRTGGPVASDKWQRTRSDLEAALSGKLDTRSKLAARANAYPPASATLALPSVEVANDGTAGDGTITIRCSNRIGRLAEMLSVLYDCNIDIRLAKVETREGEVVDTFYVAPGDLPDDRAEIDVLAARIRKSLSP